MRCQGRDAVVKVSTGLSDSGNYFDDEDTEDELREVERVRGGRGQPQEEEALGSKDDPDVIIGHEALSALDLLIHPRSRAVRRA